MSFEIYLTTAENIIGAIDSSLQKTEGIDENLVSQFLAVNNEQAQNALGMAEQLSLLSKNTDGKYVPSNPLATYLITNNTNHKAAILRLVLEQYQPYKTFKYRLELTGLVHEAVNQTRALHNIRANRQVIISTFTNLGTYTKSLISEGAGLYRPSEDKTDDYLLILNEVVENRESAILKVSRRIGREAFDFIDKQEVFEHLVTAYQRAALVEEDSRAPIIHAANAIESFLTQIANHFGVNIQNANGINAKTDRLTGSNNIKTKHKFMLKYLGHIRNAADHGIDSEIGHSWEISKSTAIEYVHVAQTIISDIIFYINDKFIV